ncbi:hypothetical protein ACT9ST_25060 (plasmid) [Sphingobium limneticum]|uniref:Uncharacterized protein n=2 Tax=Sphingobium TaxID=165695 RepID=A0A401J265_SPHXE|nr:hypothetical protein [Sphingobium subterraneum]MBB6125546.1 hypothetical protein [Sphingobium subterraneum]TNE45870.1 MAG: hypothetical protein EP345_00795 [Sphingomonadales bacterium]GBH30731.1 hypothetical protein MBESOW_P1986 [Sphingobium xenophagum]GLT00339.1 hypothetical protein GCM10007897_17230 [Sphingobium jiangsuense]
MQRPVSANGVTCLDLLTRQIAIHVPALQDWSFVAVDVELAVHDIAPREQGTQILAAIVGIVPHAEQVLNSGTSIP